MLEVTVLHDRPPVQCHLTTDYRDLLSVTSGNMWSATESTCARLCVCLCVHMGPRVSTRVCIHTRVILCPYMHCVYYAWGHKCEFYVSVSLCVLTCVYMYLCAREFMCVCVRVCARVCPRV